MRLKALCGDGVFVNDVDTGVQGLPFVPDGVQVDLPGPVTGVTLLAGPCADGLLDVFALDGDGNEIGRDVGPDGKRVRSVVLTVRGTTSVVVTDGGRGGVTVEVCASQAR